jgi:hypothetical protein
MDLQHINVRAEPLHTRIDSVEDVFPRQADAIDPLAIIDACERGVRVPVIHAKVAFGEDHNLGAWDVVLFQCFADDAF